MTDQQLEQRLKQHYQSLNAYHSYRARRYGVPASLDYRDLLVTCQAFDWCCPFCGKSLADIEHWHFNHLLNLSRSGHLPGYVVISCAECNRKLWHQHNDHPDAYLNALGRDPAEFWDTLRRVVIQRHEQTLAELAELESESLIDKSVQGLAERIAQAAAQIA